MGLTPGLTWFGRFPESVRPGATFVMSETQAHPRGADASGLTMIYLAGKLLP
jgi:hypothetical protein